MTLDLRALGFVGLLVAAAAVIGLLWTTPTPAPPEVRATRIISLSPAITETVFALGAGDLLIARSDWGPAEASHLPAVGSALTPNLEAIAGLHPEAILTDASGATDPAALQALAPTHVLPWLSTADVAASIRRLGPIVDRSEAAERLAEQILGIDVLPPADAPRVLLAFASDDLGQGPIYFIKRNSLHGDALHAAGFRNAVDRDIDGAPILPLEELIGLDPDGIIVLTAAADLSTAARDRLLHAFDRLAPLQAPKAGRVAVLAGPEHLSVGPSIVDLPAALRSAIAIP